MDAKEFLDEVFGGKPEDSHVCIWTLQTRRSHFFNSLEKAAASADSLKADKDVYVGCGLYKRNLGPVNRGSKDEIGGVPGLWMDVDVAGPAHKKDSLPTTTEEAIDLVTGNGFDPTIIVKSGYGIHAWWLFKEPLMVGDGVTSDSIEIANQLMQDTIKAKAAAKGWRLDSTHDITRVLRIPGTFNRKGGGCSPVEAIKKDGPRYGGIEDFEPFMIEESKRPSNSAKVTIAEKRAVASGITIDTNAEIPQQVEMMMSAEPKFRAAWLASRTDFKKDSPSEYVMSIASYGVRWKMNDQEICDMIISWYRQHLQTPKFANKENPISFEKLMRPDYIPGTIAKARHQKDEETEDKEDLEPITGEQARMAVSQAIGLNIAKIVKYIRGEKDPYYEMETATKVVQFKKPEDLFKLDKFKIRMAAAVNFTPDITPKEWKKIAGLFHEFMIEEHVDVNQSTAAGRVRNWIELYLEDKTARKLPDVTFGNEPFVHKGHWHVFPKQFQNFTWQNGNAMGDSCDVDLDLRRAGAEKISYNYPHPTRKSAGARRKITVWKIPNTVAYPPLMIVGDDDSDTCDQPEPIGVASGAKN